MMYEGDPNATVASSYVGDVLAATPATEDEQAHVGLPKGRIVVNKKWSESTIVTELKTGVYLLEHVRIIFTDDGSIDFYPSEKTGVVYISEIDLSLGSCYRRNLAKLRNAKLRGFVLYENSDMTKEWFYSVQKFAVLDLGLTFFPISSPLRAAQILLQIEKNERRCQTNPFVVKRTMIPFDLQLSGTFNTVHGLGPSKIKLLLDHFKSIAAVSNASMEELTPVIGKAAALQVWNLFQ